MNHSLRQQRTIAGPATVEGIGFWSGRDVRLHFRPAATDTGLVFVRCDLEPPRRIIADVHSRIEVPRRTVLSHGGASAEMVEHILAALSGLQIDNCEIWVDAAEMPGCDGSSQPLVEAIDAAGVVVQDAPRPRLVIREVTRVGDDECWVEARPATQPGLSIQYRLDFGRDNAIGRQTYKSQVTAEIFRRELAPARTFIMHEEAEWLRSQGLGQRATYQDLLVFNDEGPIDNELRYEDECVRHKALDLIGDLALAGCDLRGTVVAHRSGHRLNAALVQALLSEGQIVQPRRQTA